MVNSMETSRKKDWLRDQNKNALRAKEILLQEIEKREKNIKNWKQTKKKEKKYTRIETNVEKPTKLSTEKPQEY